MNEKQSTEQIEPETVESTSTPQSSTRLLNSILIEADQKGIAKTIPANVPNTVTRAAIAEARKESKTPNIANRELQSESVNSTKLPIEEIVNIAKDTQETTTQPESKEDNTEILPKLRPRLVKFCEAIIQGKTQAESYKSAGYKPINDNVASVQANYLLNDPKIQLYLTFRQHQEQVKLIAETHVSKEWALNKLIDSVERCVADKKERELQTGIKGINEMLGYNAPVETHNTTTLETMHLTQDDLNRSTDNLRELEAKRRAKGLGVRGDNALDKQGKGKVETIEIKPETPILQLVQGKE